MGDNKASSQSRLSGTDTLKERYSSTSHAVSTLKKMESLFLKEQFTDVVLIAGKRRIPAHRLLLSAASEYFTAMFTNDLKEASQEEIQLNNFNEDALLALINYCYTGDVEIETVTVEALLETACILQLKEVVEACCKFLKQQLHLSNCIGVWQFAQSLGCTDLAEYSQKYTCEHFVQVIENDEFLKLSVDEVVNLLGSDDLNVSSEEDVFKGLLSWIEYDLPHRTEHAFTLLKLIRFPFLSPTFILEHIEHRSLFADNTDCYKLIVEAYKNYIFAKHHYRFGTPVTRPRKGLGILYALGGLSDDGTVWSVEKYDVNLNKWTVDDAWNVRWPPYCRMAMLKGELYILGSEERSVMWNTFQCYDLKEKTLRELPPMTTEMKNFEVAFFWDSLFVIGAYRHALGSSHLVCEVERFDLQMKMWYPVPSPNGRKDFGLAVLNERLYVVGGSDGNNTVINAVECLGIPNRGWVKCASMGTPRKNVGMGVLNGFLYAVGGHTGTVYSASVERYDPKTDTWTQVASMNHCRCSAGVCALNGKLYAVGGKTTGVYLNSVEAYDPVKDEWELVAPLKFGRSGLLAATIPARL